ncbi:MAG: O-antigen ligase family protein, partial [Candidatus Latescibacterota bacterium]
FSRVSDTAAARLHDAYQSYVLNFASTTRGAAYGYTAVIADRHPLTGLGTGMYRFAAYDLRRELSIPTPLGVLDTPDNMYLVWLAEGGAIGLVAALYALVALARTLWRSTRDAASPVLRSLGWGFLAALAGFAVDMLTVDALYFPTLRTTFWALAGVAVALLRPPCTTHA